MKISFGPRTYLGKWTIELILSFFIFLSTFFIFVTLGEKGGASFFSNLKLTIPILLAAISGIAAFFIGLFDIIAKRDYSISVFLSTLLGLFVLIYTLGEACFPH